MKYPKWLLILFALSSTVWLASFAAFIVKAIIHIAIWQLPGIGIIDFVFAVSNFAVWFCIWKASKYPNG